jgi:hypothetical protein
VLEVIVVDTALVFPDVAGQSTKPPGKPDGKTLIVIPVIGNLGEVGACCLAAERQVFGNPISHIKKRITGVALILI